MAKLEEIMMTLFNNPDGYTLSVKPNWTLTRTEINFSFKGENTKNWKAVNSLNGAPESVKEYFVNAKNLPDFVGLYQNKKEYIYCRFSKGYIAAKRGKVSGKGKTVRALCCLMGNPENNHWIVTLDIQGELHIATLDPDMITAGQAAAGAVGEYRWRFSKPEDEYDDIDLLG